MKGIFFITLALLSAEKEVSDIISILGLFGMASLRLMPSLNRILTSASELRRSAAYISAVYDAFLQGPYVKSDSNNINPNQSLELKKNIKLENIFYSYPNSNSYALNNISLEILVGQMVGIVGQSGAGKTTLMDVFLGLLNPERGSFEVDGRAVSEGLSSWQKNIGFVPQQVFLLDDTLRRNIAFGLDDQAIDDQKVETSLALAGLGELTNKLPKGLSTMMGENGARLSGGQRQRVAIARALYNNPDVLLFDEATSSLDTVSEKEVHSAIESLSGTKTIFIVTHRINTVKNCDKIILIQDSQIKAVGSYEELMKSEEGFRLLANVEGV